MNLKSGKVDLEFIITASMVFEESNNLFIIYFLSIFLCGRYVQTTVTFAECLQEVKSGTFSFSLSCFFTLGHHYYINCSLSLPASILEGRIKINYLVKNRVDWQLFDILSITMIVKCI